MIRQPVKEESAIMVLGVDPGFANTGLAVVESYSGGFRLIDSELVVTKKADKRSRLNLRSSIDDKKRMFLIYTALENIMKRNPNLNVISVEAYSVSGARGGNAWKVALIYGGVMFWGFSHRMYTAPFLPMDVKKRFGKKNSSKEDIVKSLRKEVDGFSTCIDGYAKIKQEHISDATAHAVLMIEEIQQNRVMFGI